MKEESLSEKMRLWWTSAMQDSHIKDAFVQRPRLALMFADFIYAVEAEDVKQSQVDEAFQTVQNELYAMKARMVAMNKAVANWFGTDKK